MKVLHYCMNAPFTEGYSYQDNLLTEYQQKHGNDVIIVTSTRTRDHNGKIIQTEAGERKLANGVSLKRIRVKNKLQMFLGLYPDLKVIMEEKQPDIIFIHGLCSFIPMQAIAYKKKNPNVKIIADNHQDTGTTYVNKAPFRQMLWVYRQCWKTWIKNIDRVYGTTSWRVSFAQKYYGIPTHKIDTLIMGVDSDRLPANRDEVWAHIREEYGIPKNSFLFITGGKLDHLKKTIETIKAFTQITNIDTFLLIFGSVAEEIKDDFYSIVNNDKRIIYIGYVKSAYVSRLFIASDFGLFPGRHSVLWEEAIGCGLPCVFHRYEKRDHTEVCGNCICLDHSDEKTIGEVIDKVLSDRVYYSELKSAAVKAADVFSYHHISDKSLECCK